MTVFDVEMVSIVDIDSVETDISTPVSNMEVNPIPGVVNVVEIVTEGPQGIPGLQNVFVGPTPPANPNINDVWIDTNS